jgi:hypothetical protein
MLPSFADFESLTRLNIEMLRLFSGFVNKNAKRMGSHFIFSKAARLRHMWWLRKHKFLAAGLHPGRSTLNSCDSKWG